MTVIIIKGGWIQFIKKDGKEFYQIVKWSNDMSVPVTKKWGVVQSEKHREEIQSHGVVE